MDNEKSVEVLNSLIEINNDRIEGYETASKETDESDLKTLFAEFTKNSQKCKQDLLNEVEKLGGSPEEGTRTTGKFFRVWMDVKAALTGKNRKLILDSCEYGEDKAVGAYKDALEKTEDLSSDQQNLINSQYTIIKADHDKVKSMRDSLKDKE